MGARDLGLLSLGQFGLLGQNLRCFSVEHNLALLEIPTRICKHRLLAPSPSPPPNNVRTCIQDI